MKQLFVIDEAWRFLLGSNPVAANLIAQGFRTARKHNGGLSVSTRYLEDKSASIQGQAIEALVAEGISMSDAVRRVANLQQEAIS